MPNITRKPRKSTQRRTGFEAGFFFKARIWMSLEHARLRPSRQQKGLEIPDRGKQKISLDYTWCRVDTLPLREHCGLGVHGSSFLPRCPSCALYWRSLSLLQRRKTLYFLLWRWVCKWEKLLSGGKENRKPAKPLSIQCTYYYFQNRSRESQFSKLIFVWHRRLSLSLLSLLHSSIITDSNIHMLKGTSGEDHHIRKAVKSPGHGAVGELIIQHSLW